MDPDDLRTSGRQRSGNAGKKLSYPRLKLSSLGLPQGPNVDSELKLAPMPELLTYSFSVEQKVLDLINKQRQTQAAARQFIQSPKCEDPNPELLEDVKQDPPPSLHVAVEPIEAEAPLTSEQKEAVNNFCAVTGGQVDKNAERLLHMLGFDVAKAIASYFDNAENLEDAIRTEELIAGLVPPGASPMPSPRLSNREVTSPDANQANPFQGVEPMQDDEPQLKIVYPDGTEGVAQFRSDDTLWMVYQHVQESGKITPPGKAITFHVEGKSYNDNTFDTSMQDAGLFPKGTLTVK